MIEKIQKANLFIRSKTMQTIDWFLSIAFLLLGLTLLYLHGPTFNTLVTLSCGVVGIILAKIRPAVLLQDYLEKRMIQKIKK